MGIVGSPMEPGNSDKKMDDPIKTRDPMNVTIIRIVQDFYPIKGGSITHVIELAREMNPFLYKQIIFAPRYDYRDTIFDKKFSVPIIRLRSKLVQSEHLPFVTTINLLFYSLVSVIEIRKLVGKNDDENNSFIVHVHTLMVGELILFFFKIFLIKIPVVIMNHESPTYIVHSGIRWALSHKILFTLLRFFKPAYCLILNDGTINPGFIHYLEENSIKYNIVNHGIDSEFFKPEVIPEKNDEFIILSHHRLDKYKRLDLAIKIFSHFLNEIGHDQKIRLKIVGDGPQYQELKELACSLGTEQNITFTGERTIEEIKKEIDSADIVIGTSLISNINRSIMEAMSSRKPVIIFESGIVDKIFIDMENIILIPPENIEEFAYKMKLLWGNPELIERIGNNARSVITSFRSWDQRTKQELAVYKELLEG